ncbi:MAG: hypothetical protein AAF380_01610 [Bacteroidota bacterium]
MQHLYESIGKIHKVHGLKGGLIVWLSAMEDVDFSGQRLFVYRQGTYVPYLVEEWGVQRGYGVLRLVGITTRTAANGLRGCEVFVTEELGAEDGAKKQDSLVGRLVEEVEKGLLGKVIGVHNRFMQPCIVVAYQEDELLIPLHRVFIEKISLAKIRVKLPHDYIATLLRS